MTKSTIEARQSEQGFTLVELAIVMIIIGLLIGGILKGQQLIENARVSSTVSQIKAIESGISGFRDKYGGLPGDLVGAAARIPNCDGTNICGTAITVGTPGDALIANTGPAFDPGLAVGAAGVEAAQAFVQMGAAGFLGGVIATATANGIDQTNPSLPVGGAWRIGTSQGTATGMILTTGLSAGVYVASSSSLAVMAASNANANMKPTQAANIDRKIDDGQPNTGDVRASGASAGTGAGNCTSAGTAAGLYNEALASIECSIFAKVQ